MHMFPAESLMHGSMPISSKWIMPKCKYQLDTTQKYRWWRRRLSWWSCICVDSCSSLFVFQLVMVLSLSLWFTIFFITSRYFLLYLILHCSSHVRKKKQPSRRSLTLTRLVGFKTNRRPWNCTFRVAQWFLVSECKVSFMSNYRQNSYWMIWSFISLTKIGICRIHDIWSHVKEIYTTFYFGIRRIQKELNSTLQIHNQPVLWKR